MLQGIYEAHRDWTAFSLMMDDLSTSLTVAGGKTFNPL